MTSVTPALTLLVFTQTLARAVTHESLIGPGAARFRRWPKCPSNVLKVNLDVLSRFHRDTPQLANNAQTATKNPLVVQRYQEL